MYKTNQEVFDRMADHLLTQMEPAKKSSGGREVCVFRNDQGLKCAVGALIPDELYRPKYEGMSIYSEEFRPLRLKIIGSNVDPDILYDTQRLHDWAPPELWNKGLQSIAENYKLNAEVLKKYESV